MALIRTIAAVAILLVSFAAHAEKRVALVIGNSAYQTVGALRNPVRDAKAVAAALREAGFAEVTEGYDLSKAQFDDALKQFGDAGSDADWALIFYAGHGIGIGGETYVLPVDTVLKRADHADDEAVSLSRLRFKASGAKALRMVILDSCRENPFASRLAAEWGAKRAISRGLPAPAKPEGDELIAYATRENDVADDGEGAHSPFTAAFLQHLREPALEVRFLFGKVRDSVQAATGRQQTPTTYGDLGGTYFYFRPPQSEVEAPAQRPSLSEVAEAWGAVEHTDSEAALEAFIKRFGETAFSDFARARLNEIGSKKIATVKPTAPAPKPAPPAKATSAQAGCIVVGERLSAPIPVEEGSRLCSKDGTATAEIRRIVEEAIVYAVDNRETTCPPGIDCSFMWQLPTRAPVFRVRITGANTAGGKLRAELLPR